jgi:hypothetical protein
MCYRCSICNAPVGPKVALNRWIIYRNVKTPFGERQEIAKELPVCGLCKTFLAAGLSIKQVLNLRCPKPKVEAPKPVFLPIPPQPLQAESIL